MWLKPERRAQNMNELNRFHQFLNGSSIGLAFCSEGKSIESKFSTPNAVPSSRRRIRFCALSKYASKRSRDNLKRVTLRPKSKHNKSNTNSGATTLTNEQECDDCDDNRTDQTNNHRRSATEKPTNTISEIRMACSC